MAQEWGLTRPENFRYLRMSGCTQVRQRILHDHISPITSQDGIMVTKAPTCDPPSRRTHIHPLESRVDQAQDLGHHALSSRFVQVAGIDDEQDHQDMKMALTQLRFMPEDWAWMFSLAAGILHLGNVTFAR
jgi:hypothetical protein